MNTDLYVSFQIRVFVFPGYVCKSRIAHAFVLTLVHNSFPLQLQLLLEISKPHSLLKLIQEQRPGEIKVVLLRYAY